MGTFERWLSLWVALAIAAGVALGNLAPGVFQTLAAAGIARVNLPVALLIWAMVFPMMVGVDFGALRQVGERPKGLVITLTVNWLIKPFTMAALGVLFFNHVFAGLIPPDDAQAYLAGLILLGAAPCTAMVFVWSQLTPSPRSWRFSSASPTSPCHGKRCSSRWCSTSSPRSPPGSLPAPA
jgi:ACR3 family arsenite transporter